MSAKGSAAATRGGGFLLEEAAPADIFTPERLTEEQRLAARTMQEFLEREVLPHTKTLEGKDWDLTRRLIRRLGDLGVLGAEIPEAYGGLGLDKITSLVVTERLGPAASFAVSVGAHIGIGTLPIVFFGTDEQKRRYLPRLAHGDLIGAYALTEPTAGSDAMANRTSATRTPDGSAYLLTGAKQFITNAAFADLFITYAKVDGEQHTAFIVERSTPGLTVGDEEHKMGIRGSSTASLFFDQARVPAENLLGEIGQGHKVAFNILNVGRFNLAAGALGAAKTAFREAVAYAKERRQFGRPLAAFGLIKQKLAQMAVRLYVGESMVYRTGGLVDGALGGMHDDSGAVMAALEEYAVECSINKVFVSEVLDYVVDEMVQIYGGYGFIEEYPAARAYRDARINRLFEGTNEINRLLITGMLLRRAQRGQLPLIPAARAVADDLLNPALAGDGRFTGPLAGERQQVAMAKKAALFAAGVALQKHLVAIEEQQEILAWLADMVTEIFAMESAVLRAAQAGPAGEEALPARLARAYLHEALPRVEGLARQVLAASAEGEDLRTMLAGLRRFIRYVPLNAVAEWRAIADRVTEAGRYPL
ncbi:MAG: acyl-CoA dehydrogenase family protein [Armatimonadetes bacterium]|nr:acyl-CoA dehydrogenase family protein [Armatimonadota bacterium]